MTTEERKKFWALVETGDKPLLSVMSGLVEKWGLHEIIITLGELGAVLAEDAIDAKLTSNQRGFIIGTCAQVCDLSDQLRAEMEFLASNE